MKKLLSTLLLSFLLLFSATSFAETDNYLCSRYNKLKIKNVEKWNEFAKNHYYTEKHGDVEVTIGRDVNDNLEYVELFVYFLVGEDKRNMIQKAYATRESEGLLDEADLIGMSEGTVVYTYEDILFGRVK